MDSGTHLQRFRWESELPRLAGQQLLAAQGTINLIAVLQVSASGEHPVIQPATLPGADEAEERLLVGRKKRVLSVWGKSKL